MHICIYEDDVILQMETFVFIHSVLNLLLVSRTDFKLPQTQKQLWL